MPLPLPPPPAISASAARVNRVPPTPIEPAVDEGVAAVDAAQQSDPFSDANVVHDMLMDELAREFEAMGQHEEGLCHA